MNWRTSELSASVLTHSDNKRVSGFMPSALRPNPRLSARTSDIRKTLSEIPSPFIKNRDGR